MAAITKNRTYGKIARFGNNSKTLNVAISHANSNRNKPIKQAVLTLCQLVKAIDNLNGKFGIGGIGDIFLL
jgi:hypothetical protein